MHGAQAEWERAERKDCWASRGGLQALSYELLGNIAERTYVPSLCLSSILSLLSSQNIPRLCRPYRAKLHSSTHSWMSSWVWKSIFIREEEWLHGCGHMKNRNFSGDLNQPKLEESIRHWRIDFNEINKIILKAPVGRFHSQLMLLSTYRLPLQYMRWR